MIETRLIPSPANELAIFGRIIRKGKKDLSPSLARYVLSLDFDKNDKTRMSELALRNQDGDLTPEEKEELLGYAKAGCLLGILQSKARKSLKKNKKQTGS